MPKAKKGRIGGDVLADIKKWTKNKPEIRKAMKQHQRKHEAKIAKRNIKESQATTEIGKPFNCSPADLERETKRREKATEEMIGFPKVYYNEIKKPVKVIEKGYTVMKTLPSKLRFDGYDKWMKEQATKGAALINRDTFVSDEEFERFKKDKEKARKAGINFVEPGRIVIEPKTIILKCQNNQCTNHNPLAENGCAHYNDIGNCSRGYTLTQGFLKPAKKKKEKLNIVTDMDFVLGATALLPYTKEDLLPKKKRIPTRFNAKKLRIKHSSLWTRIETSVRFDIFNQIDLYNHNDRRKGEEMQTIVRKIVDNVAENAAFTAIVEMIKRGLL